MANGAGKVDFGDELDYDGDPVSELTTVGYSVFTTNENSARGINMPSIKFEIDPHGAGDTTTTFSTLVFTPAANTPAGTWTHVDATTEGRWGLTGAQFNSPATAANCGLNGPECTFAEVKAFLASGTGATVFTAAVGKGRDFAFEGAVDGLEVNDDTVNFEPNSVIVE